MRKISIMAAALMTAGLVSTSAEAANVISRTTDVTITFDNANNFANASALYSLSFAYGDQTPFDESFDFQPVSNAQNITFQSGPGGVTVTPPAGPNGPPDILLDISSNGIAGSWSASYNSAATNAGPLLSFASLGGLDALNFTGGGSSTGTEFDGIGYYVFIHVQGDWLTNGTSTGDFDYIGANAGFGGPTASYDGGTNMTTFEWINPSYTNGEAAGIDFNLVGAAAGVPEPAIWSMMLIGFGGIGGMLRSKGRKVLQAAAA